MRYGGKEKHAPKWSHMILVKHWIALMSAGFFRRSSAEFSSMDWLDLSIVRNEL
jgi:hypothetical protein